VSNSSLTTGVYFTFYLLLTSDVNKDWTCKDKDKDQDKDKD